MSVGLVSFLAHCAATWALCGLIVHVQAVQYPLFATVGAESFPEYHAGHMRRISWVVAPLMLIEAATAGLLLVDRPHFLPAAFLWAGIALMVVVWSSTLFFQIPLHRQLEAGFSPGAHRRLVRSNWIRTVSWSARGVLLFGALARGLGSG